MTLRVRVFRFDPAHDGAPRYETYEIPGEGMFRVLDVLDYLCDRVDPSLNYRRYLCRDTMCNSCFVKVNGRPRLTCLERVPSGRELVLEPLDTYALERDLIVDFSRPLEKGKKG